MEKRLSYSTENSALSRDGWINGHVALSIVAFRVLIFPVTPERLLHVLLFDVDVCCFLSVTKGTF